MISKKSNSKTSILRKEIESCAVRLDSKEAKDLKKQNPGKNLFEICAPKILDRYLRENRTGDVVSYFTHLNWESGIDLDGEDSDVVLLRKTSAWLVKKKEKASLQSIWNDICSKRRKLLRDYRASENKSVNFRTKILPAATESLISSLEHFGAAMEALGSKDVCRALKEERDSLCG